MAQHDYVIDNSTGANVRADINSVLQAIASNNSGSSAPSTTFALQFYADTTNNILKLRNAANDGFINLFTLAGGVDVDAASNFNEDVTFTGASANIVFDKSDSCLEFADNAKAKFGSGDDTHIYHNGAHSYISHRGTGDLILEPKESENGVVLKTDGAVELYFDNNIKIATLSTGAKVTGQLNFDDGSSTANTNAIAFGSSQDCRLFHSGSAFQLRNTVGQILFITPSGFRVASDGSNETMFETTQNGAVEAYFDGNKKFETTSSGIAITGGFTTSDSSTFNADVTFTGANYNLVWDKSDNALEFADNAKCVFGGSNDLRIFHTGGGHSSILNLTNNLILSTPQTVSIESTDTNGSLTEQSAKFIRDGQCELYFNNSVKLTTTSDGVDFGTGGADDICCISGTTIHRTGGNGCGISFSTNTILPSNSSASLTDGTMGIGSSSHRFGTIFAATGSINTSDKNEKNTIIESDLGLDFINKLKPISFKWNNTNLDSKTHYGLVAQDIEEILSSEGKTNQDFAALDIPTEGSMGLNYTEFISPLIKAIQELSAKVAALEAA